MREQTTNKLTTYADKHGIYVESVAVPENPSNTEWKADHWLVAFKTNKKPVLHNFRVYYSKGIGLRKKGKNKFFPDTPVKPTIEEVLECLQGDFQGLENSGLFEDWADEYGYNKDSRKAEKTYETVKRQAYEFKQFVGHSAYRELLAIDLNEEVAADSEEVS